MADVVQRFFHRSDLMIPEQAYQERPDPDKKCCGRCKKIRENEKFVSATELIAQMKKDEKSARRYFRRI